MKKSRLTKLGSLFLGLSMALGVGAAISAKKVSEAKAADKITTVAGISSGSKYYIGATVSETDYYFKTDGSSLSNSTQGTSTTKTSEATILTFEAVTGGYTIKFESGNYLSLNSSKDNGKVVVTSSPSTWAITESSGLLNLKINNYCLMKNSGTSLNFGSYASGQKNVWLMSADSGSTTTYTLTLNSNNGSGETSDLTSTTSSTFTLPDCEFDAPSGKQFKGWSTSPTGAVITDKTYTISSGTSSTLYAIWEDKTATKWVEISSWNDVVNGSHIALVGGTKMYNGTITKGHGQVSDFSASSTGKTSVGVLTTELVFDTNSKLLGVKLFDENNKSYLYITAASSGKLSTHNEETSYWTISSSTDGLTLYYAGVSEARLRYYSDTPSFRTYGANNGTGYKIYKFNETVKTLESIAITSNNYRSFYVGDDFVGEEVTATYSTGESKVVTATYSGYDMKTVGEQTVTVTYKEGLVQKTVTYKINVLPDTLINLSLSGNVKGSKSSGWDLSGVIVTGTFEHSGSKVIEDAIVSTNTPKATSNGKYSVVVTASVSGSTVTAEKTYQVEVVAEGLTISDFMSVSQALDIIATYESGGYSETKVFIKGKIIGDVSLSSGKATFNLADLNNNSKTIKVYNIWADEAGTSIAKDELNDGDEIYVCGVLMDYSGTPEIGFKNSTLGNAYYMFEIVALTGISITENLTIKETMTAQIETEFTPENASNKNLSFVSSDTNIASVSNTGLVTGIAAGTTTITATSEEGGFTDICTITVIPADPKPFGSSFALVKSGEAITAGKYLIGYSTDDSIKVFNGGDENNGYVSAEPGETIEYADGMAVMKIEEYNGGYSLQVTVSNTANNEKYIYGTSGSNALNFDSSACKVSISIDTGNKATISSNTSIFRFNTDSNSQRFRFYKSTSTSYPLVSLYKLVESDPIQDWIDTYMHMDDYDPTLSGKGTNACLTYFGDAKDALLALGSAAISEFSSNDKYKDARERYESWATQNGQKAYEEGALELRFALGLNGSEDSTWIIAIVAIAGLTAITGCLFYRKRRKIQ